MNSMQNMELCFSSLSRLIYILEGDIRVALGLNDESKCIIHALCLLLYMGPYSMCLPTCLLPISGEIRSTCTSLPIVLLYTAEKTSWLLI